MTHQKWGVSVFNIKLHKNWIFKVLDFSLVSSKCHRMHIYGIFLRYFRYFLDILFEDDRKSLVSDPQPPVSAMQTFAAKNEQCRRTVLFYCAHRMHRIIPTAPRPSRLHRFRRVSASSRRPNRKLINGRQERAKFCSTCRRGGVGDCSSGCVRHLPALG